jgi:hypothetical protein
MVDLSSYGFINGYRGFKDALNNSNHNNRNEWTDG